MASRVRIRPVVPSSHLRVFSRAVGLRGHARHARLAKRVSVAFFALLVACGAPIATTPRVTQADLDGADDGSNGPTRAPSARLGNDASAVDDRGSLADGGTAQGSFDSSGSDAFFDAFARTASNAASGAPPAPRAVRVVIDTAAFAGHPVGARLGPLMGALLGLGAIGAPTGFDLVRETRWVRASAVSASPFRSQWVLFSTTITKHEVDTTLRRIERGVAHGGIEPWAQAPDPRFSSHRVRDAQRTRSLLVDRDSDRIAIVAPESRASSAQALAAIPATAAPATPNHAVLVTLDDLSAIASVPGLSDRGHWLTLDLVPGGGARAVAHVACVNAMAAEALAASLRETVGWKNSLMVRLVTRSLLSQFDASAEGAAVTISLPASDAQLSAAVNLLAGEMGVPPPMMYGADAGAPSGSLPSR